jgi:hypothetical protein
MQSSAPQRSRDVAFRDMDGEMVLVSAGNACAYSLNGVGSHVWRQIDGQRGIEEIAADVARSFGVPLGQALADVRAFLDDITREGLLATEPGEEASDE